MYFVYIDTLHSGRFCCCPKVSHAKLRILAIPQGKVVRFVQCPTANLSTNSKLQTHVKFEMAILVSWFIEARRNADWSLNC